jgi:hypothetical protein
MMISPFMSSHKQCTSNRVEVGIPIGIFDFALTFWDYFTSFSSIGNIIRGHIQMFPD